MFSGGIEKGCIKNEWVNLKGVYVPPLLKEKKITDLSRIRFSYMLRKERKGGVYSPLKSQPSYEVVH